MSAPPVTPQRTASHNHSHSVSASLPQGHSPASPYTPLSLRSFASASASSGSLNPSPSSTLTTPASVTNLHPGFTSPVVRVKKLSWASPSPAGHSLTESPQSLADLARNWRSRASENGIKVSHTSAKMILGDDSSILEDGDVSLGEHVYENEEILLPPPFMSTQRRRALSHAGYAPPPSSAVPFQNAPHSAPRPRTRPPLAPLSPVTRRIAPSSPVQARRPSLTGHQNVMATPPPNRHLAERLRLKGSFTDPAQPRRREAFDAAPPPGDVSFDRDLFDIHEDENDDEYELEYDSYHHDLHDYHYQPDHGINGRETQSDIEEEQYEVEYPSLPPQQKQKHSQYHQYQYQQPPLPPSYTAHAPSYSHPPGLAHPNALPGRGPAYPPGLSLGQVLGLPVYGQAPQHYPLHPSSQLAPAHVPMSMSRHHHQAIETLGPSPAPSHVASSSPAPVSTSTPAESQPPVMPNSCSICARRPPSLTRLAILTPCGHALCPSCLTSALNIVGEKDMECAGCREKVVDFKLVSITANETDETGLDRKNQAHKTAAVSSSKGTEKTDSFLDSMLSSHGTFENGFDLENLDLQGDADFFGDEALRASTPPPMGKGLRSRDAKGRDQERDAVVLRIDNVPWDITPPRISAWLGQPVIRVHVLLDKKGKTMSHAFVEVEDEVVAGKILRGEVETDNVRRVRGSVLGKGKRARGVTVTRSSQGELMTALFPSWLGTFDGSRPSLAGIDSNRVIVALESGLMTETEVACLLYLIRSPDAHFLKVPSLPFHSLISVLAKFPADVDSRVFWSGSLRDTLFDVTFAAIQMLVARIESMKEVQGANDEAYPVGIVDDLTKVALDCQAFTSQQTSQIFSYLHKTDNAPSRASSASISTSDHSDTSRRADPTDADVEDEDGENDAEDTNASASDESHASSDELRTPSSGTAAGSVTSHAPGGTPDEAPVAQDQDRLLDDLAREFGVDAQLVEALAQRLALSQR